MKKTLAYILAGVLTLLGFSSCASLRQARQERLERDPVLRRDWDPVYGDRMQKIVFIGQHLDKPGIKQLMDDCLAE